MRPSSGDRICGQVQIDEEAAPDLGAHAFGGTLQASLTEDGDRKVWLSVVERGLVPSQVDVSSFMARMGELLSVERPALVPVRLVDREADFCVVGYEVMPGAVSVQRRIEGTGSTAGLVARVAVEVARGLAHLHAAGRVHGALAPSNIVLWQDGVALWQHGLAVACSSDAIAPKFRALGGDVVAPEVRMGGVPNAQADVYAWGAVVAALATDTVGSAALAAVEDGELEAGLLTDIVVAALSGEASERPADGLALLRCISEASVVEGASGAAASRQAELRALAGRYVSEVEGKDEPTEEAKPKSKRRQFRRTATELYPPGLEPIAGVMIAPDEPEPDPFTVPTDEVAPAEVHQEEPQRVPTPAPMQITARRIEDEPNRHFNPDALTPPDGARLSELEQKKPGFGDRDEDTPAKPPTNVSPGGVSLPPLVMSSPGMDDDFTPEPTRLPLSGTPAEEIPVPVPTPAPSPPAAGAPIPSPPPTAAIPPPPAHDDMSPEDSGFGLSAPITETLDSRLDEGPGGVLAAATSSPRLSTVDGVGAEPNPALAGPSRDSDEMPLELDLPTRASRDSGGAKKKPRAGSGTQVGHVPAPIPVPSASAPSLPVPAPEPPAPTSSSTPEIKPNGGPAGGPKVPLGGPIELDLEASNRPSRPPMAAESGASRPATQYAGPSGASGSFPRGDGTVAGRGPRGSLMAAVIGFGATILAVGLTVPVAQERGGLSVLLGERLPEPTAEDTDTPATDGAQGAEGQGEQPPEEVHTPPPPPTTCPPDMAALPKHNKVCIDVGEQPGLREKPKTGLTFDEASAVCEEQGRRLCSPREWREACRGTGGRRQPYAGPRKEGHCNDALSGVPQNLNRGGARETCVTPEGVFDLVGNAGEWVADGAVLGGDATTSGASCQSRRKPGKETQDMAIGFRCCVSLVDPNAPTPSPDGKAGKGRKRKRGK